MTKPAPKTFDRTAERVLPQGVHIAASANFISEAVAPEVGSATTWNMLLPAGNVIECRDGRVYQNPDPQAIVDAYNADSIEIMIDTNHDSVWTGWDPAAHGWVKKMELREGSIWGEIEWTDNGVEVLSRKHYRYLSPAFLERPEGTITAIVSLGLVNQPAMTMPAVARSENPGEPKNPKPETKESIVDEEQIAQLRKAYGLADDASVEDVIAASLAAAPAPADDADAAAAETAAAAEAEAAAAEDSPEGAAAAGTDNAPDLTQYVPRADYDLVAAERDALKGEAEAAPAEADIEAAVDAAIATARIAPASRAHYIGMCSTQKGFESFKAFAKTGPKVVATAADPSLNTPATAGSQLSSAEIAVCRSMGISQEKFIANKKAKGA